MQIDKNLFIEEIANNQFLNNVTKYCSRCYKEFKFYENIYFNLDSLDYFCKDCAYNITQEIENEDECCLEYSEENTLF